LNIHQGIESIVPGSVTTLANARWWTLMKIKNEIAYQITMNYLKDMLEKKIISIEEYNQMMVEFKKKYTPKVSHLFFEIAQ
jgi:tyrosine-protein phosphatase YwqE